jgi:phage gpG-like protein
MITFTKHAQERAEERCASVQHGKSLFRKACKALKNGKAKDFPSGPSKRVLSWLDWRFVHVGSELVTLYRKA